MADSQRTPAVAYDCAPTSDESLCSYTPNPVRLEGFSESSHPSFLLTKCPFSWVLYVPTAGERSNQTADFLLYNHSCIYYVAACLATGEDGTRRVCTACVKQTLWLSACAQSVRGWMAAREAAASSRNVNVNETKLSAANYTVTKPANSVGRLKSSCLLWRHTDLRSNFQEVKVLFVHISDTKHTMVSNGVTGFSSRSWSPAYGHLVTRSRIRF